MQTQPIFLCFSFFAGDDEVQCCDLIGITVPSLSYFVMEWD